MMRTFIMVMVFSTGLMGGVTVDVTLSTASTPPEAHSISYSGAPMASLGVQARSSLAVSIIPIGARMNNLRLTNIGDRDIQIPISRDGMTVYRSCGTDSFLKSSLVLTASESDTQTSQVGSALYGCKSVPGTTAILRAGTSVDIRGWALINVEGQSPAKRAILYSLSEERYGRADGNLKLTSKGIYAVRVDLVGGS